MKNLVLINLGSNSLRMTVNQIRPAGGVHEVKYLRNACRLSHGMGPEKIIQPGIVQKALHALSTFKRVYTKYPQTKVIAVATAAVREARNRREFLTRITRQTGIQVKVLSGVQEANYDYLGLKKRISAPKYLVMDCGGGSIELVGVDHDQRNLISLNCGAVSLTERFHLNNLVSGADLAAAQDYFLTRLRQIKWLNNFRHVPLVLLGGAHRALVRIDAHRHHVQLDQLSGSLLNRRRVLDDYCWLLSLNLTQRKRVPGLETNRADVILGGLLPLTVILNRLDSDRCRFSSCGVRQGLIEQETEANHD